MRANGLKILVASVTAVAVTGCGTKAPATPGGEPTAAQRTARIELIRKWPKLNDVELAHLCPALYPADVLSNAKKYNLENRKVTKSFTPEQLAMAAKAACGKPVPVTPAKQPAKSK